MRHPSVMLGVFLALAGLGMAEVRADDITRTPLQKWEIPGTAAYDLNTLHVVIAAGGTSGRHIHPGVESTYVISGQTDLKIDGQADRELGPGEYFLIEPGTVHEVLAKGSEPAVLVLSYITERGQPMVEPAP